MFRTAPAAEVVPQVVPEPVVPADPVPLSVLALDLDSAPAGGWTAWLADRGIAVVFDDIGRQAIARDDAKKLLDAQRLNEVRRQDQAARLEQQAIEADRAWRATIWKGVSADLMPAGALPASVMLAADKDSGPRRRSVLEDSLQNSQEMVFHRLPQEDDVS
jgi:hypothetical protein